MLSYSLPLMQGGPVPFSTPALVGLFAACPRARVRTRTRVTANFVNFRGRSA